MNRPVVGHRLTCIYLDQSGAECGQTYDDLVLLQEHLRDEHLMCDTSDLQRQLARTQRLVSYQGQEREVVEWDNRLVYDKIEWVLPDGKRWLRAEPVAKV